MRFSIDCLNATTSNFYAEFSLWNYGQDFSHMLKLQLYHSTPKLNSNIINTTKYLFAKEKTSMA